VLSIKRRDLQRVGVNVVCLSVLQHVAVCWSVWSWGVLECVAAYCSVWSWSSSLRHCDSVGVI